MFLEKKHFFTIIEIIQKNLPHSHVFLFGSRYKGTHFPYSDVDLLFDNHKPLEFLEYSTLREDFEESNIPYFIDIVDLYSLEESYKKNILQNCQKIF